MNEDEMFLRERLAKWENRFVTGEDVNPQALIALQNYFIAQYGFARFCEVKRQVQLEVLSSNL